MGLGFPLLFWKWYLSVDFFTYTHYPVRFNRKTRKVYFFRHNGPDGVTVVPWDDKDTYFHIGRGDYQKFLRDLRCHVLSNGYVTQTFTIGHYFDDERGARGLWEFIRRYMEHGPEAATEHPLDRHISLSVTGTWINCYMWVCAYLGEGMYPLRHILFPLYAALTACRWLVFKSCKVPVWPPEVEAECAIAPDDPNRWREPKYMAQFAERPGMLERAAERLRE